MRPVVEWYNLIWTSGISKHNFIGWLVCRDRLPTTRIIAQWIPSVDIQCNFCMAVIKDRTLLFFECEWTNNIWQCILAQHAIRRLLG